jgi:hypothetical protein
VVADTGMSEEAKVFAQSALSALLGGGGGSEDTPRRDDAREQLHVMLSYQWDCQSIFCRLNESLITRGYRTWFD